jgi:hypothetical protein
VALRLVAAAMRSEDMEDAGAGSRPAEPPTEQAGPSGRPASAFVGRLLLPPYWGVRTPSATMPQ